MARIVEDIVVVKISRIARDDEPVDTYVDNDLVTGMENVLTEALELPAGAVLEVAKLEE